MGFDLTDLRVFRAAELLGKTVWDAVVSWDYFAKKTVGEQLVRAADSIGANIAEAQGRYHYGEKLHFLYYARGSLYETRFWLRQAFQRKLLKAEQVSQIQEQLDSLPLMLNNFINSIKSQKSQGTVKEETVPYTTDWLDADPIAQSPNLSISPNTDPNPF